MDLDTFFERAAMWLSVAMLVALAVLVGYAIVEDGNRVTVGTVVALRSEPTRIIGKIVRPAHGVVTISNGERCSEWSVPSERMKSIRMGDRFAP